jgi:GAF domain-containing protein
MQLAPIPRDEKIRLEALQKLQILDTDPEARFDDITKEALAYFNVPLSTVSILDDKREWYKSCQGMCKTKEGSRDISFCGHALMSESLFIVEDTKLDPRFADNPYVLDFPFIRFYAGMRLLDSQTKQPIGVFCIKDTKPRKLSASDIAAFIELANRAEQELNKSEIIRTKA